VIPPRRFKGFYSLLWGNYEFLTFFWWVLKFRI